MISKHSFMLFLFNMNERDIVTEIIINEAGASTISEAMGFSLDLAYVTGGIYAS